MNKKKLEQLLIDFKNGQLDLNDVLQQLKQLPYQDLGFARLDHHRALRKGTGEIVFCRNKSVDHAEQIILELARHNNVLATHAPFELFQRLAGRFEEIYYNHQGKTLTVISHPDLQPKSNTQIYVITAGTSDIPVAEEAVETASFLGCNVKTLYDVGVAGMHRFFDQLEEFEKATALIVVAGMDGVLPSLIGGLVSRPVIAVPTSVGYGASFHGIAPLLTMLNSCVPGVTVVNIDNGFGAGYFAALMGNL